MKDLMFKKIKIWNSRASYNDNTINWWYYKKLYNEYNAK